MKKLFYFAFATLMVLGVSSCNKEPEETPQDTKTVTATLKEAGKVQQVKLEGSQVVTNLHVKLSKALDRDAQVSLGFSASALAAYDNECKHLSNECCKLASKVTIASGKTEATATLTFTGEMPDDGKYGVAVCITGVDGQDVQFDKNNAAIIMLTKEDVGGGGQGGTDPDPDVDPDPGIDPSTFVKQTISSGSANQEHTTPSPASPVSKLFDGSFTGSTDGDIFHTPWGNESWGNGNSGTVFPVELTLNLSNTATLGYINYYTRTSLGGNNENGVPNGCPGTCDLYLIVNGDQVPAIAGKGGQNNPMYDLGQQVHSPYKFEFSPVKNVTGFKLVFYSGSCDDNSAGYISGLEVEAYGLAE